MFRKDGMTGYKSWLSFFTSSFAVIVMTISMTSDTESTLLVYSYGRNVGV